MKFSLKTKIGLFIVGAMSLSGYGGENKTARSTEKDVTSQVTDATQNFYKNQAELTLKPGNKRTVRVLDLMFPLLGRRGESLLFLDIRGVKDNKSSQEYNFGLGYRRALQGWQIASNPVILGGYGYYDARSSPNGFFYRQATLGVEALHPWWQARLNGYYPDRRQHAVQGGGSGYFSGFSYIFTGGREGAMPGWDAEVGARMPLSPSLTNQELFLFAGGYQFKRKGYPTVQGPRFRAEYWIYDVFGGVKGFQNARLKLGAETSRDKVRGSNTFLEVGLMIPLNVMNEKAAPYDIVDRTMTLPVVRDVDVVAVKTQNATKTVMKIEGVPARITHVRQGAPGGGDGTAENPYNDLQEAVNAVINALEPNPIIYIHGPYLATDVPLIDLTNGVPLDLKRLTFLSPAGRFTTSSGTLGPSGSASTLSLDNNSGTSVGVIEMENPGAPVVMSGFNITTTGDQGQGVWATNGSEVMVMDSSIRTAGLNAHGVRTDNATITFRKSSVRTTGAAVGIYTDNESNVTILGSSIRTQNNGTAAVVFAGGSIGQITGSTLTATGQDLSGLFMGDGSKVILSSSSINATGLASVGMALKLSSRMTMIDSRVLGVHNNLAIADPGGGGSTIHVYGTSNFDPAQNNPDETNGPNIFDNRGTYP